MTTTVLLPRMWIKLFFDEDVTWHPLLTACREPRQLTFPSGTSPDSLPWVRSSKEGRCGRRHICL